MNQTPSSPSADWNERAARGDAELRTLLDEQDVLFAEGSHREEADRIAISGIADKIRHRQAELGIDPMEGPEYPGR